MTGEKEPKRICVPGKACETCPYRRDTPSGIWAKHEYEKLPAYDHGRVMKFPDGLAAVVPELAIFHCHQTTAAGKPIICRGWLSVHRGSTAVRLGVLSGRIDVDDLPKKNESDIYYESGKEACAAGLRDFKVPTIAARYAVHKLAKRGIGKLERPKRKKKAKGRR